MKKILFIIRSLDPGGAERQLVELVRYLNKERFKVGILSFYKGGILSNEVRAIEGVELVEIGKKGRWDLLVFLFKLIKLVKAFNPDIICGFLTGGNIVSVFVEKIAPGPKVIWSIRASNIDFSQYTKLMWFTFVLSLKFSSFPYAIVFNSYAGLRYYFSNLLSNKNIYVIPNGIKLDGGKISKNKLRDEWGVSDEDILIGIVGRIDPMKDHETFLKSACLVSKKFLNAKFIVVGGGDSKLLKRLKRLAEDLGIEDRVIWTGFVSNMEEIYSSLDILVSSSYGEGFPNVIGEAMSYGVPCVVTNVGDCRRIIGKAGILVPPKSPEHIAKGIEKLIVLRKLYRYFEFFCPERVEKFSIDRMVKRYEEIFGI